MIAITRAPRLLVKLTVAPPKVSFAFAGKTLNAGFEHLFDSIRPPAAGLGAAPEAEWYVMSPGEAAAEVNAWDLCHHISQQGFGIAGMADVQFAEPDFEQQWATGTPVQQAIAVTRTCDAPAAPDKRLPTGTGFLWFRGPMHSQLEAARTAVGQPADRVRIAHCDTGYDPNHETLPQFLRKDLQRNFVENERPQDATDHTSGILTNLGHGTGTLSILAGGNVDGVALGGAPFLDVVPIRVANSVVLFRNSAIAKAFDYIHGLYSDNTKRVHVVTMSMGGLASQAWADAVNALYDLGVFVVAAGGNNFGGLPTRNIVYPARFKRVVAACGVMADGTPYADLPLNIMGGNYGPASKMATAMAAFTPNTPWARLGCNVIVDYDGKGTSASTPQIAAAAALWVQTFKSHWEQYPQGWMRVEAVRKALFDAARLDDAASRERLGNGAIQANSTLSKQPADATALHPQPLDTLSFPFLRLITGFGIAAAERTPQQRMLELEALQLAQRFQELEQLLPDPENVEGLSVSDRQKIIAALHAAPGASRALRTELERHASPLVGIRPHPYQRPPFLTRSA